MGTTIGSLKVLLNGETIDVVEVKSLNSVEKKDIWDYFEMFASIL